MRQIHGVFAAIVVDNLDPENLGRLRVRLPHFGPSAGHHHEAWARLATMMAGSNRGSWFIPDVNDEVLIAFEGNDLARPYVIGCLWNGANPPPTAMTADNNKKLLRSRNGVTITLDDQDGAESFLVETPGGQTIRLKDGPSEVEISDANGNLVHLKSDGISVVTSAKVAIEASQVTISAGMMVVNAGMSKFSGVVQCDTLIANSVVSTSYTPGAGNIA
jgi:uncharacterized protein involved in type VI secretion and phage assembly